MYKVMGDIVRDCRNYDVIVHGCNCFHVMGAGVAKSLSDRFPDILDADKQTPYGDRGKLGTLSAANYKDLVIVNAYTQFGFDGGKVNVDYDAVRNAFSLIKYKYGSDGKRIAFPMIGAGLAGGEWKRIRGIIEEELGDEDTTLVYWEGNGESSYYAMLITDVLEQYPEYVAHYQQGKHHLMGLFTAQAMLDSKSTADPKQLLKVAYNILKD